MAQDKKNMWIWDKVSKTNPKNTKKAKVKGRELTTINATSQIEQATEIFGSYGKGFGISSIQFDDKEFSNQTILLIANAVFFYKDEDGTHEFPISSSILYAYITRPQKGNPYLVVDNEAYKKIETDITTKALSKLGFSADIFKGKYDDNQYVNSITKEFGEVAKEDPNSTQPTQFQDQGLTEEQFLAELEKCYNKKGVSYLANNNKNIAPSGSELHAKAMNKYNSLPN